MKQVTPTRNHVGSALDRSAQYKKHIKGKNMAKSLKDIEIEFQERQKRQHVGNENHGATKGAPYNRPAQNDNGPVIADDLVIAGSTRNLKIDKLLLVLFFIIGMSIFIYPPLSDYIARRNVVVGANSYEQNISSLSTEEKNRLMAEAKEYNDSLSNETVEDPFIPGSGRAISANYNKVLNTEDGIMGYVDIRKISVYLPIRHGSSEDVLTKGAGHIEQTHLPIGGEGNLSVVTAHTGFAGADMFNRLIELEIGDTFMLHVLDQTTTYRVDDISVIDPEDIEKLLPVEGKDYTTLITCTPYGVNSHRLLVRGIRIPNVEEAIATTREIPFPWRLVVMSGISIFIFIVILVWNSRRDKKRREDAKA